MNNKPRCSP